MKIAIISDIHSNLFALQSVVKDIAKQGVDDIYSLGDVTGYCANPSECFELVSQYAKINLRGNHEDAIISSEQYYGLNPKAQAGVKYSKEHLTKECIEKIHTLPYTHTISDLNIVLCHGSYSEPEEFHYIMTPLRAKMELERIVNNICVIGHTHSPFVFGKKNGLYEELPDNLVLDKDDKFIVNVGSVGQPRDGDCRSCYGLFETNEKGEIIFNLRRCYYDIEKTANAIIAAKLPAQLADRLFKGE